MATRAEVEYHISGLDAELRDGLDRLWKADQAIDHAAFYRHWFNRYVAQLRAELDSPTPDIHAIAVAAMQAAWLARIWPVLQSARLQWRAPGNLKGANKAKRLTADQRRDRCTKIAKTLNRPTPARIQREYRQRYPGQPVPADTTIRRYLSAAKK